MLSNRAVPMENGRLYLLVFVTIMAFISLANADECNEDIQSCANGGSAANDPADLTSLSSSVVNAVCATTEGMSNAFQESTCVYIAIQATSCYIQYGSMAASFPQLDFDNVQSSFMYVCANQDAYVRALNCMGIYSNDSQSSYTQCVTNAVSSLTAAIDRSQSQVTQVMQTYCSVQQGVQYKCLKTSYMPQCQDSDLQVVKNARLKALPPSCSASGFKFSIFLLIFLSVLSV